MARAKLFMNGRSQAVRLPKEFRLPGKEVEVRRDGRALVLAPVEPESADERRRMVAAWFERLAELADPDFMPRGREQPPMQPRRWDDQAP